MGTKRRLVKRVCPICRTTQKVALDNGCKIVQHPAAKRSREHCAGSGLVDLEAAYELV